MSKKYCVIIGDIIQSKEIKNRKTFQKKFYNILKKINKDFASEIISKFTITIGDEFQGVLKDLRQSNNIIDKIQEMLYPIRLRFGVGWGRISTNIRKVAIGMDGPAFHHAREAILMAERKGRIIIFKTGKSGRDLSVNTLALSLEKIKDSWTMRQREVINYYQKWKNQKKVAQFLKIKQPTVATILASSKWDWYSEVVSTLNSLLITL